METFAFTFVAANYEAPGEAPRLREFSLELPTSQTAAGVVGSLAALSLVVSAPDAHALIRRGTVCAEVGDIQRALLNFNYSVAVDNVFGPATEDAVRSYQARSGLAVDGVVGPATAASLGVESSCGNGSGTGGGGVTVDASSLNVRTGPSTANAVIRTLARGTSVQVTSTSNGWALIRVDGIEGWVAANYLSGSVLGEPDIGTAGPYTVSTTSGSGINVRSSPNGSIAYGLANGTTVDLTTSRQFSGGYTWGQLTNGNWVAMAFLSGGGGTAPTSTGSSGTGGGAGTLTVDTASNRGVNVRTTPNGTIAYGLAEGATVSVTSARRTAGGYTWAQLTDSNWVATSFLR
ncbi:MAG: SH3 domain-containing protein [Cyanothece sp. SIO2G6]|nr:SH3 domain-containing protein [Cyanothece sp. SIO2G6]